MSDWLMNLNRYNLPADAIHAGLPLIDTRRTLINDYCPAFLKKPKCTVKRYREFNGLCNNLEHAHWGATLAPFRRLLPPDYADGKYLKEGLFLSSDCKFVPHNHFLLYDWNSEDRGFCKNRLSKTFEQSNPFVWFTGISAPRASAAGVDLPSPRLISAFHHKDMGYHDHAITVFLPAFGQLLDHDLTRGADSKGYLHFLHLPFHLFLAHLTPTFLHHVHYLRSSSLSLNSFYGNPKQIVWNRDCGPFSQWNQLVVDSHLSYSHGLET